MSIGRKIYLGFGAVLGIVVLLLVVNIAAVQWEHSARRTAARAVETMRLAESIQFQMMQNRLYLANYLQSGDTREADSVQSGYARLTDLLKQAEEKSNSDQQRSAFTRFRDAEREWLANFATPLIEKRKEVDAGNMTVADLQVFYLQLDPGEWLRKSTEPLAEAGQAAHKALEESDKSSRTAATFTTVATTVGTMLAMLCGLWIAYVTTRSIVQPLGQLIAAARQIGNSGDLDHKVEIERSDEIGELAQTFNSMVEYLREMAQHSESIAGGDLTVEIEPRSPKDTLAHAFRSMIEGLRSLARDVRDSASQVSSGAMQVAQASEESAKVSVQASSAIDEVSSTMHEMSINVQNMVKNTQMQASSVSETSASIDQMVASIQRVADTARVLLDISQRSREEVQNGIATMDKATEGLTRINGSIHASAEIIGVLGNRADDIGKIIEVIDDLAEQTNLLALNAAIEAARAGEHGLGFAVVADEVRKLAEKSAQSTKEISELIQSIQKEARKAVENMEKSTVIVNDGLTLGGDLNQALKRISSVVTEVYKFAQEIGAATNEQSHGSSQIAKATTRLNEITHEINSSVEEQASGARGVMKAMEKMRELVGQSTSGSTELAASAEQMSRMSRALLEVMDRFSIDAHQTGNGNGHGPNGNGRKSMARKPKGEYQPAEASRYAAASRS
ncbi:MAG TPA: methyl-accepting chemotaxis protein [Terriglobales bacterium]|nr:methyl-accepting chemotaxis protein [Terriglobales bacterium]